LSGILFKSIDSIRLIIWVSTLAGDLNKIPDNEKEEVSILAKQINKLTYNINRQL
jgi:HAMP domain-containing protein